MKLKSKFQIKNVNRPSYSLVSTCDIYPKAPVQRPGQSERFYPPVTLWNTNPTSTSIGVGTEYSPSFTLNDASTVRQMAVIQPAPAENIPTLPSSFPAAENLPAVPSNTVQDIINEAQNQVVPENLPAVPTNTAEDINDMINEAQNQVVGPPDLPGSFPGSVPATTSVVGTLAPLEQTRAGGLAPIQEEDENEFVDTAEPKVDASEPQDEFDNSTTNLVDISNPVEQPQAIAKKDEELPVRTTSLPKVKKAVEEDEDEFFDADQVVPTLGSGSSSGGAGRVPEMVQVHTLFQPGLMRGYSPNKKV